MTQQVSCRIVVTQLKMDIPKAFSAKQRRISEIVNVMVGLVVVLGVVLASKTLVLGLGSGWSVMMSQSRSIAA